MTNSPKRILNSSTGITSGTINAPLETSKNLNPTRILRKYTNGCYKVDGSLLYKYNLKKDVDCNK